MSTHGTALRAALAVTALVVACTEGSGSREPLARGLVSLALSTRSAPGATFATMEHGSTSGAAITEGDTLVIVRGGDTLVLRSVELVLREIELERVDAADCLDSGAGDDACEEFETGPLLVSLPLGGDPVRVAVSVSAPSAQYDELEFEVHEPDERADAGFLSAHPEFAEASIRARGTFSDGGVRTEFVYVSDLDEEQEIALFPFLEIGAGEPVALTLRFEVASWFLDRTGRRLVNPATANEGGPNEDLVSHNIARSIDAFRDDNRNGLEDRHEGG